MFSSLGRLCLSISLLMLALGANAYQLPDGEVLNDPTRPANWNSPKEKAQTRSYKLSYILTSKDRRQAIINGRKVEEGDRIGAATIVKIAKNSVTVKLNGKLRTLGLKRGKVSKKTR